MRVLKNRSLVWALIQREITSRYKGSYGGLSWYVIQNLLLLSLYTFVFGTLFQSRWSQEGFGQGSFTVALFIGLVVFNIFAECVTRAPTLILANANFVKKVVFPLEILPVVQLGAALFNALVAVGVLMAMALWLGAPLFWQGLWLPVIILPLLMVILGLCWFLSALGAYVRDVNQLVSLLVSATMFLSPLFYPLTALPASVRGYLVLNPLTIPMEEARQVLMFGQSPDFVRLSIYMAVATTIAFAGMAFFQKARRGFADVI